MSFQKFGTSDAPITTDDKDPQGISKNASNQSGGSIDSWTPTDDQELQREIKSDDE